MDTPPTALNGPEPDASSVSMSVYVWPAVRYAVAALGIAAIGIGLGSWVFAPLALLAVVQSVRISIVARRGLSDQRLFGSFGDGAALLVAAGSYHDLLTKARIVATESQTREFRAWGVEWAGYAAIGLNDHAEMRSVLPAALTSPVPPHVPGQLYAALGDYKSAVPFLEESLVQRRDDDAVIGFVHALAASGNVDRASWVIESAHDAEPTTALTEWLIWSKLERDLVADGFDLTDRLIGEEVSAWGMSVCQVAALRAGDHKESLAWGERALAADPHPSIRSVVKYNRACSFAQTGDLDQSLQELEQVDDAALIQGAPDDEDLQPLWHLDAFHNIVAAGP